MGIPYTVQLQSMASSFVGWMRKSVAVMMALFLVDLPIKNCVFSWGKLGTWDGLWNIDVWLVVWNMNFMVPIYRE